MSDALRIAVFSDVHGNVQGLEAVLAEIRQRGPFDQIIAAGDHCLNGPEPAAALDLVVESATDVLYGNTDRDIVDEGANDPDLGEKKRDSIEWTREQIGPERIEVLAGLAFSAPVVAPDGATLLVVHANPHDVDRHIFPDMEPANLEPLVGDTEAVMIAFGHLHIPYVRFYGGKTLVNIAAAGLPRDGDRRATWGEFTWERDTGWQAMIHRVEYEFEETVRRIYSSGMPHPQRRAEDLLRATYE